MKSTLPTVSALAIACLVLSTADTATGIRRGRLRCCCWSVPVVAQPQTADRDGQQDVTVLFDGRSLKGLKVADQDMFKDRGKVAVKDGQVVMAAGSPATGVVLSDHPPRIDYEIELEAKRTSGSDFFCGLTFPIHDQYCSLILGGWGGGTVGLSNIDNLSADENESTEYLSFDNDRWYRIRLRVTGDRIAVWLDDKQIIDIATKGHKFNIWWEQEPMRPLGVASWHTGSALRHIRLRRLGGGR